MPKVTVRVGPAAPDEPEPQAQSVPWEQRFQLTLHMQIPSNVSGLGFTLSAPGYDTLDAALDAVFHAVDRINTKWDDQARGALGLLAALGAVGTMQVRGLVYHTETPPAAVPPVATTQQRGI